jgi:hypothetical protein
MLVLVLEEAELADEDGNYRGEEKLLSDLFDEPTPEKQREMLEEFLGEGAERLLVAAST